MHWPTQGVAVVMPALYQPTQCVWRCRELTRKAINRLDIPNKRPQFPPFGLVDPWRHPPCLGVAWLWSINLIIIVELGQTVWILIMRLWKIWVCGARPMGWTMCIVYSWSVPNKWSCQIVLIWARCFSAWEYNVSKISGSGLPLSWGQGWPLECIN